MGKAVDRAVRGILRVQPETRERRGNETMALVEADLSLENGNHFLTTNSLFFFWTVCILRWKPETLDQHQLTPRYLIILIDF